MHVAMIDSTPTLHSKLECTTIGFNLTIVQRYNECKVFCSSWCKDFTCCSFVCRCVWLLIKCLPKTDRVDIIMSKVLATLRLFLDDVWTWVRGRSFAIIYIYVKRNRLWLSSLLTRELICVFPNIFTISFSLSFDTGKEILFRTCKVSCNIVSEALKHQLIRF